MFSFFILNRFYPERTGILIFLRPWFLLLLLAPIVLFWIRRHHQSGGTWKNVCDPHLLPYLIVRFKDKKWHLYTWFMLLLWALAVLCAAGPALEKKPIETGIARKGIAVVVDMSPAMTPEKLFQARLKLYDLLQLQKDADFGLVLTDEKAYTVLPMTSDKKIFENILPSLTKKVMPVQGENPSIGIKRAASLLKQAGFEKGQILLLTGGLSEPEKLMSTVRNTPYPVSILGFGNETEPKPVQLSSGKFWEKTPGIPVLSGLNSSLLKQGAQYETASLGEQDLKRLLANVQLEKQKAPTTSLNLYQDFGIYGLILLLPLTALLFRHGILFLFTICLLLPSQTWASPWKRSEQVDFDIQQQAVDAYRAGAYDKAAQLFSQGIGTDALYNLGNALAFQVKIDEAIQTYEAVLKQNPQHEDAAFNLDYLKKQQQQAQQNQSQDSQTDNQNNDAENQKNTSSDTTENEQQSASQNESPNEGTENQKNTSSETNSSDRENESNIQENQKNTEKEDNKQSGKSKDSQSAQGEKEKQEQKVELSEKNAAPSSEQKGPTISGANQQQEEWLERIDSDPGRLLRIRLLRQYEAQK